MKPTKLVIAAGVVLASLAISAPVHAQSARIVVGAVFGAGAQYPPPPPYSGHAGARDYDNRRGEGARQYARGRGFDDGYNRASTRPAIVIATIRGASGGTVTRRRGYDRDYRMSRNDIATSTGGGSWKATSPATAMRSAAGAATWSQR